MLLLLFLTMLTAIALPLVALIVLSEETARTAAPVRITPSRRVQAPITPQQLPRPPSA